MVAIRRLSRHYSVGFEALGLQPRRRAARAGGLPPGENYRKEDDTVLHPIWILVASCFQGY